MSDMIIITGADKTHFKSACQCIRSIQKHEPTKKILFWDFGLTKEQSLYIQTLNIFYEWFDYTKYPDYYDITKNAGEYGWKSAVIMETVEKGYSKVLWLDAGNVINGPLHEIETFLDTYGIFYTYVLHDMKSWTYSTVFEHFTFSEQIYNKNMINAAFIGFHYEHEKGKELLQKYYEYSKKREYIAPIGSSRSNHRQDQSLLSCIIYESFPYWNKMKPYTHISYISIHKDCD